MALPTLQSVFSSDQIDILEQWIDALFSQRIIKGTATMVSGTIFVSNASIALTDVVNVTANFALAGELYVTLSDGVGFTIQSTSTDDGTIMWSLIR